MSFDLFHQPSEARKLAQAGATLAADYMDRLTGGGWSEAAYNVLRQYLKTCEAFQCSAFRAYCEKSGVPDHPLGDHRAFGAIIRRAYKAGLIRPQGYATTDRRVSHGRAERIWQVIPQGNG